MTHTIYFSLSLYPQARQNHASKDGGEGRTATKKFWKMGLLMRRILAGRSGGNAGTVSIASKKHQTKAAELGTLALFSLNCKLDKEQAGLVSPRSRSFSTGVMQNVV